MMCMSTLVDALRIWKKTDKFQSYFKTVKAIVWILTVMMKTELHWWTCNHCWKIRLGNIVLNFLGRLHRSRDQLQIECTVQRHGKWQISSTALTISAGIMDQEEARRKDIGWKILGFLFYRCKALFYIISVGKKYVTELGAYLVTPALGELSLRTWFMLNPWVQEQIQPHSLF